MSRTFQHTSKPWRVAPWVLAALLCSESGLAGANTWTGSRPFGTTEGAPNLVSADSSNPSVVYGAFGSVLYRSGDGGRTWNRLRSFDGIHAILAHPASSSAVYVAGVDGGVYGVLRSLDGGETWTQTTLQDSSVTALAGSPTDSSTVFAGGWSKIYKTTDSGAHWSPASFVGAIASLVLNPREPSILYAGADYDLSFGYYPGAFGKSEDGGASWRDLTPESFRSVLAVGVDPVASSTIYVATGPDAYLEAAAGVLRSEDAGLSWTSAEEGLPDGVQTLVVDPRVSGTLYVGTSSGVYRSRDSGRSWTAFGQRLAGSTIHSLSIDDDGRRLYAGTQDGVLNLEIASGPLDVASGAGGVSRVLYWNSDRLAVGALDASGHWTRTPFEDSSATWTATAIAEGGDGLARVLWQCGDGRSALEIVGPAGRQSATVFVSIPGWIASDLAVRSDGRTDVLWTSAGGRMRIAKVDSSGAPTLGPGYGPAIGWSAVAIADGPGGATWVLWRSTDGRAALSLHRDGVMSSSFVWAASAGWTAEDIAVGADGRPRLLRTKPDGSAQVSTVDAAGRLTAGQLHSFPDYTPRRIAGGSDGLTRLLFSAEDGPGALLLLNADNTESTQYAIPVDPALGDSVLIVTTTNELEAALSPANAGRWIHVRAGEYELSLALTVPDHATLAGEGEMSFDESGLPIGFKSSGRTLLRSAPSLVGDVLMLGDGATVRGLVIEDALGRQGGNPVVVSSRAAGDFVSALLADCEIINPNPSGIVPAGPTGRGLVALTRNPNLGLDPPSHEGAAVRVEMRRSLVRSPGGGTGVFAINFASHTQIRLVLQHSVIDGGLIATGGVSRPDAVTEASVSIESGHNLYSNQSALAGSLGWNLIGGAGSPAFPSAASTLNRLHIHSKDDTIHGFQTGIVANGGQRFLAGSEPSSSNRVDMDLHGLRVHTTTEPLAADLVLFGARSFVDGVSPGDGNTLRLLLRQSTGSGPRVNLYGDSWMDLGVGNELEIVGTERAFVRTNDDFDPIPPAEFFTAQ